MNMTMDSASAYELVNFLQEALGDGMKMTLDEG